MTFSFWLFLNRIEKAEEHCGLCLRLRYIRILGKVFLFSCYQFLLDKIYVGFLIFGTGFKFNFFLKHIL